MEEKYHKYANEITETEFLEKKNKQKQLGQKNMCVSDVMGLQHRVGRSGIFFLQYFCIVLR